MKLTFVVAVIPQTSSQNILYFHLLPKIILFSLSFSFRILGSFFSMTASSILLHGVKKNTSVPIRILMLLSLYYFSLTPFPLTSTQSQDGIFDVWLFLFFIPHLAISSVWKSCCICLTLTILKNNNKTLRALYFPQDKNQPWGRGSAISIDICLNNLLKKNSLLRVKRRTVQDTLLSRINAY